MYTPKEDIHAYDNQVLAAQLNTLGISFGTKVEILRHRPPTSGDELVLSRNFARPIFDLPSTTRITLATSESDTLPLSM